MSLLRQVLKSLLHRPWYSASIVTVMAVACALLTSVLAIVDGVLFKSLGYPGERDLVAISVSSSLSKLRPSVDPTHLDVWAQAAPGVRFTGFNVSPTASSAARAIVQQNFFDVVGVRPAIGGFSADDFSDVTSPIEPRIVTDELFRSQFGADPEALGRVVILDPSRGDGYRIVGVMPRGFVFPSDGRSVGFITTLAADRRISSFHHVIARLPAAMTTAELGSRVVGTRTTFDGSRITRNAATDLPIDQAEVEPLSRALGAASRPLFLALLAAAALLVTIAALNASSLMAARSVDRRRELAVRRALGATPFDIGRLLLVEAALLVGVGATLGLLISTPLLALAAGLLPSDLGLFRSAAIDWRVLGMSAAMATVLAGVVTTWPLRLASTGATSPDHSRSVTGQARSMSWRVVITAQVALALVLTIGGSLLVGSLLTVYGQTPAIATTDVHALSLEFLGPAGGNGEIPARTPRANALVERVKTIPGVEAVAFTAYDLLDRAYVGARFKAPATALNSGQPNMLHAVTAEFYDIIQPQIVAGRLPAAAELARDEPVIVVSELVANNYWPNGTAVGQSLTESGAPARVFTVVGVVKDIRWHSWDQKPDGTIYGPYALLARQSSSYMVVRTAPGAPLASAEMFRVLGETDPFLETGRIASLDYLFVDSVRPRRFRAWLFGTFAFASLVVAGLGIFGQLAMSTARRTREVGIRMACGATRGGIARLILHEQLVPVVAGLVSGGLVSAWAVRFIGTYLYQITSSDARVWGAAVGLILLTAAAGTLVPALRASRVNPTEALRAE